MANDKKGGLSELAVKCPVDSCAKAGERAGFCGEHFAWFKEGLVSKKGERPRDFDKKYQSFLRKTKKIA